MVQKTQPITWINPDSDMLEAAARAYINHLDASRIWDKPIATRIEHGGFFPAEAYHQNFAEKHPYFPYIMVNDRPKIAALRHKFPTLYKG
jgi:peptide-methionine (S)-S-oxide reductase